MRDKLGRFKKGHKHSKETIKKLSDSLKGKKVPQMTGEKNPNWKEGRQTQGNGYIRILKPNHPFANKRGYIYEHRLVMEKMLGRYLTLEEVVHHNGTKYPMNSYKDKGDNRPENLRLFANESTHQKFHHPKGYRVSQLFPFRVNVSPLRSAVTAQPVRNIISNKYLI